jgi:hypothetical protein
MNNALKLVFSAALVIGVLTTVSTLPACGGGTGGTGGGSATGGGSGATGGSSGTGGGSGGGSGGGGGSTDAGLNCTAYCTAIMANCTGPNAQFSMMDRCMNACTTYPAGMLADTTGNTLGCRIYHAGAAHMDPVTHCVHAGPGGAGVCGANCDGYCQLTQAYCTTANQAFVYPDSATCKTHCMKFGTTVKFSVADDAGTQDTNEVACLLYHAQEATTNPMDHCLGDLANDGGNSTVTCAAP